MDNIKPQNTQFPKNRRKFLLYLVGGTAGTLAIGCLSPKAGNTEDINLENLCTSFPYNSRCQDYLPGVMAVDSQGNPIKADSLLATATSGTPIPVEGLPKTTYLVIEEGPKIASYGIRPVCTHLGCTVEWKADVKHFVCPCHGSEYDATGQVTKGPANRALPTVTVIVKQNQIRLSDREIESKAP
jgi:cytochrome b6-f complex iron-sulfur subunit